METKFNFNSQVCTSHPQSKRLLTLGLKKETADMFIWIDNRASEARNTSYIPKDYFLEYYREYLIRDGSVFIPAWSLHRLICMIPEEIVTDGYSYNLCIDNDSICHFEYSACTYDHFIRCENLYDAIVGYIEWLIKKGYFNKKYLNS